MCDTKEGREAKKRQEREVQRKVAAEGNGGEGRGEENLQRKEKEGEGALMEGKGETEHRQLETKSGPPKQEETHGKEGAKTKSPGGSRRQGELAKRLVAVTTIEPCGPQTLPWPSVLTQGAGGHRSRIQRRDGLTSESTAMKTRSLENQREREQVVGLRLLPAHAT